MLKKQRKLIYTILILAILLIIAILIILIAQISTITAIFTNNKNIDKFETYDIINGYFTDLEVSLASTSFEIVSDDSFKIKTNNKNISITESDNKLLIKETKNSFFNNNDYKVKLYVPYNYIFEIVNLNIGAGLIDIEDLQTSSATLNFGAGKVDIENLVVSNNININGGTGTMYIESGSIYNLDLDMGVGEANITSFIAGTSSIKAGVGTLKINLLGIKDDYTLDITDGLGKIKVNNEVISKDEIVSSGDNKISIKGSVGSIDILFSNYTY